jgi:hypothetical protein
MGPYGSLAPSASMAMIWFAFNTPIVRLSCSTAVLQRPVFWWISRLVQRWISRSAARSRSISSAAISAIIASGASTPSRADSLSHAASIAGLFCRNLFIITGLYNRIVFEGLVRSPVVLAADG